MASRFRHYAVYVQKKKIATMSAVAYDLESGDELQFGAEGVLGHSDGITTVKLEADCVIPVAGSPVDFLGTILNKKDVSVMIACDGKLQEFSGRIVSANYSSNSRNGEARGKFTFTGGQPDVAG